jgi:NADPH:quinone reductase-like Zn-dependent oxidoreductase
MPVASVAICAGPGSTCCEQVQTTRIDGEPVSVGLTETPRPRFDPQAPDRRRSALVRVNAFSCNYRDGAVVTTLAARCRTEPSSRAYIGSDFTGVVEAVGADVAGVHEGDRVIGDSSYPYAVVGAHAGVPTNHASCRFRILHESKLMTIPAAMPDEVAAGFGVAAQTSYSMIRRLAPSPGASVLVTAARSATSLVALGALRARSLRVYAATTATEPNGAFDALDVERVVRLDPARPDWDSPLRLLAEEIGGFDYVVDPFFDVYLERVIGLMSLGGRYVTCGLRAPSAGENGRHGDLRAVMVEAFARNVELIGNCLGSSEDLAAAVDDYARAQLPIPVDSIFDAASGAAYLDRSFNARDRFGKVVCRYDD